MISECYSALNEAEYELMYADIMVAMNKEDPLIAQVFEMKAGDGLSVREIAKELGITTRQVYYYLKKAQSIGRKYLER